MKILNTLCELERLSFKTYTSESSTCRFAAISRGAHGGGGGGACDQSQSACGGTYGLKEGFARGTWARWQPSCLKCWSLRRVIWQWPRQ